MATTTPNFGWSVPTSSDLVKNGAVAIETLGDAIDASLVDLKGGTTDQVLAKNSNTDMDFKWVSDATGMTNPMTTTGDVIYSSSGSTPARLGIGTAGQVLKVNSGATAPEWGAAASGALTLVKARTAFSNVANTGTTFDSVFTSSYKNYLVVIDGLYGATSANEPQIQLLYSGSTQASGYYGAAMGVTWETLTLATIATNNAAAHNIWTDIGATVEGNNIELWFSGVGNTSEVARWNGTGFNASNADIYSTGCKSSVSRTYTGFLIKSSSSNVTGYATVYGLAAA
jgi:hypothetical protein